MEVKKLGPGEVASFRALVEIFKLVFENDQPISDDDYLKKSLNDPNFIVFAVEENNRILGGLTLYTLHHYYGNKPIAYIYDVGIHPEYQGKGIGKALMSTVANFCRANGYEEAYVEAEADDLNAVNFYRKTSFKSEMKAIQFSLEF